VGDSGLHEAVRRQRTELWVRDGYMKLCVDRYLNCGVTVGYMKPYVERDQRIGCRLVT